MWSQMFLHNQTTGVKTPKSRLQHKVTISLLEVVLGLLQPDHPVLDLQINLRFFKMVSNDSPYPKSLG